MGMFDSQIVFYGKHAEVFHKYCKQQSSDIKSPFLIDDNDGNSNDFYIFNTNFNCYIVAALLGIINDKKEEIDNNKEIKPASIFADMLTKPVNARTLKRIYQHMVLKNNKEKDADARIKEAFKDLSDDESKIKQKEFEDYVRGGLTIIDEKFKDCKSYEDICDSLIFLIDDYSEGLVDDEEE